VCEDVSVRPMAEVDITAGRSLLGQLGYDLTLAEMRRRYIAVAGSAGHTVLVAECDGRLVGLMHLYVRPALDKPPEVIVQAIVIDTDSRNRGIGKSLMSAAERWARERGTPRWLFIQTSLATVPTLFTMPSATAWSQPLIFFAETSEHRYDTRNYQS